jgi:hypothetical protein
MLVATVLGSLLSLSVGSVALARVIGIGQPSHEIYPDAGSTRTVIDAGSRYNTRLRAIDAMFYPDSFGATGAWMIRDVNYQVA